MANPKTSHAPLIAGIVAALVLLFGAYMGSYYAMLEEVYFDPPYKYAAYRWWNSDFQHTLFTPANQIDRMIRPNLWKGDDWG